MKRLVTTGILLALGAAAHSAQPESASVDDLMQWSRAAAASRQAYDEQSCLSDCERGCRNERKTTDDQYRLCLDQCKGRCKKPGS